MTASYIKFFYYPVQRQTCQHSKTISLIDKRLNNGNAIRIALFYV